MPDLLDKQLIFVTGKGGVGKSTVAAALGLVSARRGLRTIVAEVSQQDRVARAFHHDDSHFREVELAENLFTISIDPDSAIEEYLHVQVKIPGVAEVLSRSRMFQYFAAATPGMRELVTMGKLWELAQLQRKTRGAAPYDLVIVDAPATGHGVAVMRSPKTFADIARVGPIAHQGRTIHEFITDETRTGVVAVARPEELPVAETLALATALKRELGVSIDRIVVNAVRPERLKKGEPAALDIALGTAGAPRARAALRAALAEDSRARCETEQVERLAVGSGNQPVQLPFLFAEEVGLDELADLSRVLEERL